MKFPGNINAGCRICSADSKTLFLLCPDHTPHKLRASHDALLEALGAIATDCPQAADMKFITVRSLRRVLRDTAQLARVAIKAASSPATSPGTPDSE